MGLSLPIFSPGNCRVDSVQKTDLHCKFCDMQLQDILTFLPLLFHYLSMIYMYIPRLPKNQQRLNLTSPCWCKHDTSLILLVTVEYLFQRSDSLLKILTIFRPRNFCVVLQQIKTKNLALGSFDSVQRFTKINLSYFA